MIRGEPAEIAATFGVKPVTRREIADEIARLKHRVELLEAERDSAVHTGQQESPRPTPYPIYAPHVRHAPGYFHPSRN